MVVNPLDGVSIEIMQGDAADYHALAELLSACYPDFVFDPLVLQAQDENGHAMLLPRWVARQGPAILAYSEYRQMGEKLPPHRLAIHIAVHPEYRGRGLGGQLYHLLLSHLPPHFVLSLRATVRSEDASSLAFLKRRGFVCEQSLQEWAVSLPQLSIDSMPFCDETSTRAEMVICNVAELQTDPARNRKLHRLIEEIRQDTLLAADQVTFPYETFEATYLGQPSFFPDMALVAVYAGEYIGYSDLRDDGAEGLLYNLTGVVRKYRRQGVATALKKEGLARAQARGYVRVRTFCDAENTAIQALNRRFGFLQTSAWTHLCRSDLHAPLK